MENIGLKGGTILIEHGHLELKTGGGRRRSIAGDPRAVSGKALRHILSTGGGADHYANAGNQHPGRIVDGGGERIGSGGEGLTQHIGDSGVAI